MPWDVSLLPNRGWNFGPRAEVQARLDQAVVGIEWLEPDPAMPAIVREAVEKFCESGAKKPCRTPEQIIRQMSVISPVGFLHELAYLIEIKASEANDKVAELRLACIGRDSVIDAVRRMAEALEAKVVESASRRQIDFERDLTDSLPVWRQAMRRDNPESVAGA